MKILKFKIQFLFFTFILINFFNSVAVYGQESWQKQSTGIENHIYDIDFINLNKGWFVGSEGVIYFSIDGGVSWNLQESNVSVNLNAVCFINENTGYIAGDNGIILKTTNGGEQWQKLPPVTDAIIADVLFTDELTGWAVAQTYPTSVLKTTNGGTSWKADTLNTTFPLYDITKVSENKLVVSGGFFDRLGYVALSTDAGETWSEIISVTGEPLFCVQFTGNDIGYAMGGDFDYVGMSAWKTSDGGNHWTEMSSPLILRAITDMEFINPDTAWVCVTGGLLYRLTVNDENWENFESGTIYSLYALDFVDDNYGWVCGAFGFVAKYLRNPVSITEYENSPINNFKLFKNYPNPFNPYTNINYQLPAACDVEISVYNIAGQKVKTWKFDKQASGYHRVKWDAKDENGKGLSSGIYIYTVSATGMNGKHLIKSGKMVLLR